MKLMALLVLAIGLALGQTSVWDQQGRAEFASGQLRSAKASFQRAVREAADVAPEQAMSLTNLGQTLLALGELAAARDAVARAAEVLPDSAGIRQLQGQILIRLGKHREAERVLRSALHLAEGQPETVASCYSDLATLLLASGRKKEGAELLAQAVEQSRPGQARARMLDNLGVLQWKSGKKTEASGTIRRALMEMEEAVGERHPDVARILEDYAEVLAKSGQKAESRAAAARAEEMKTVFGWQANSGSATVDWRDLRN